MENKDVSVVALSKEYFGHKIEVKLNSLSGIETIYIDGNQVSRRRNWFKLNGFHRLEINKGFELKHGFVQVRTYLLDCVVGIKLVIDNEIIEKGFWPMPVQMSFRQLILWVPMVLLLCTAVVALKANLPFTLPRWTRFVEFIFVFFLSSFLSNKLATAWATKATEKVEKEMSEIPNPETIGWE